MTKVRSLHRTGSHSIALWKASFITTRTASVVFGQHLRLVKANCTINRHCAIVLNVWVCIWTITTRVVLTLYCLVAHTVVTLGRGVTRDEFAQACKRMRKLHVSDNPHTLVFATTKEVFQELERIHGTSGKPSAKDVLVWTKQNTTHANIHALSAWADHERVFNERQRTRFHNEMDDDHLERMYSGRQHEQTYTELAKSDRYNNLYGVPSTAIECR